MFLSHLFPAIALNESHDDYRGGKWLHYSDHPMLAIAPKFGEKRVSTHQDPSGIYFFPESFKTFNGYWMSKKYCYTVTIDPSARILDFVKLSEADIRRLAALTGATAEFEEYIAQYPPEDLPKMGKMAWEMMRMKMMMEPARWNKLLRQDGWDAIFDDTGAIHSVEVQLLVLNPKIIHVVNMVERKDRAFAAMQKVLKDLSALCAPFGEIEVTQPKRKRERWGTNSTLEADLSVRRSETNFADFRLTFDPSERRKTINVHLRWSRPHLSYGVGVNFSVVTGEYEHRGMAGLEPDLRRIFAEVPAETD